MRPRAQPGKQKLFKAWRLSCPRLGDWGDGAHVRQGTNPKYVLKRPRCLLPSVQVAVTLLLGRHLLQH